MKKFLLIAALCAAPYAARADEAMMMGVGVSECNKLTAIYRMAKTPQEIENVDFLVGSWASGFMSAANFFRRANDIDTKNLGGMQSEQQVISIRRYCKHHPNEQVMRAVADLYQSMTSNVDGQKDALR